jgi:predicted nucleic acid-binding protein
MATTAADPVFVDTNVLVYSALQLSPLHKAAVGKIHALRSTGIALWISRQVLREYLAVLSRPGTVSPPISMATLVADVSAYQSAFQIADENHAVTANLLNLLGTVSAAGKQIHDANIVATMLANGIPRLLTHNAADFTRFASVITVESLVP